MPQVVFNGNTYDSDNWANYGYLDPERGVFACWNDMLAHIASASNVNGVSATPNGAFLKVEDLAWVAEAITYADISDASTVLDKLQALTALGSAKSILRMNAAGTAIEFGSHLVTVHGAYRATNQTLTNDGAYQTVVLGTTMYGSGMFNLSTGVATLPSDGLYHIQFRAQSSISTTRARLLLDGATPLFPTDFDSATPPAVFEPELAAGATLALQVDDDTSGITVTAGDTNTHLIIRKVGEV